MTQPLVSIIIPCYNAEAWVAQALESALAQTWEHKEIILVNDGSRDGSLPVAKRFESRGVQVVDRPNRGASAARNHGLRLARGDFIQYLDADDLISPQKIELQLARLTKAPSGSLATCRWGRFTHDPRAARFVDTLVFQDFTPLEWLLVHVSDARMMHPAAWLVPRPVAERVGPWDETLSLNDDGEYFARAVRLSSGLAFTPEIGASTYYRSLHSGSLSGRRTPLALASLFKSAEGTAAQLARYDDPRVRPALANFWQRLGYELYPENIEGSRVAFTRAKEFGGSNVAPQLGRRAGMLSNFIGWRLALRIARRR